MSRKKFDDEVQELPTARLYTVDGGEQMTFEQLRKCCPHVTEKMLRDRLFQGERKLARLGRPPDRRKGVDKPKSWR